MKPHSLQPQHAMRGQTSQGMHRETIAQRVLRQLIEALLFEQLVEYRFTEPTFYFSLAEYPFKVEGKIAAFGRIRLDSEKLFYCDNNQWLTPHALFVVEHLPSTTKIKQQLADEIQQTLNLCKWNADNLPRQQSRRNLAYHQLESALHEGHPYHPCFKARSGFSIEDHIAYGPECAQKIKLHWLAVKHSHVKSRFSAAQHSDYPNETHRHRAFWLAELGLNTWQLIEQRLRQQGANWDDYRLLPAHPWQIKKIAPQLKARFDARDIIDLGQAGDHYQASISVRTLINLTHPQKANIKLPLSMVNTSSLRTIEAHSIGSAPLISQWLNHIVKHDNFFQQQAPLVLLAEYAGVRLQPPAENHDTTVPARDDWAAQLADELGVIFRESLEQHQLGEHAVPFTALSLLEQDGLPFIHPWIERYGCQDWLQQLIKTTVIPVWHLLVHHGIALEAHAQNMILVHDNGWPSQTVLRDFHESLEFVDAFLKNPQQAPNFTSFEACYRNAQANQYYWMNSIEALRELIVDTLFVFNLTELSHLMNTVYGFSEQQFWQQVYSQLQAYQQNHHTSLDRLHMVDIYKQRIQTESLLKRKLSENKQQEFHHEIANGIAHQIFQETAVVCSSTPSHQ